MIAPTRSNATVLDREKPREERRALLPGGAHRLPVLLGLFAGAIFVVLAGRAAFTRPPWLDELTTLWYVTHGPVSFIDRISGDPHPIAWYLVPHVASWLSTDLGWLRLVGLVIPPLAVGMLLASALGAAHRRRLLGLLAVVVPSVFGARVFVQYGTDLRMYGALTLVVVVIAVALHGGGHELAERGRGRVIVALSILAALHIWGALLAAALGATWILRWWRRPRRSEVLIALASTTGVLVAYRLGVLSSSISSWSDFIGRNLGRDVERFQFAFTTSRWLLTALLVLWLMSLAHDRGSVWWFDVPAMTTLGMVQLIGLHTPISKDYTIMPVTVLLLAGTLLRLRAWPAVHLVAVALLMVGGFSEQRWLFDEKQDWQQTTDALAAQLVEGADCDVIVFPVGRDLEHTRWFLGPEVSLVPLGEPLRCQRPCEEAWWIFNHADRERRARLLLELPGAEPTAQWRTGAIGTVPCAAGSRVSERAVGGR